MEYVVNMDQTPVIFPKMTWEMICKGEDVKIEGKREADTKLASVLFAAGFASERILPDCMYYNVASKEWKEIYLKRGDTLQLFRKGTFILELSNQLPLLSGTNILTLVKNFVTQFSSASISMW